LSNSFGYFSQPLVGCPLRLGHLKPYLILLITSPGSDLKLLIVRNLVACTLVCQVYFCAKRG